METSKCLTCSFRNWIGLDSPILALFWALPGIHARQGVFSHGKRKFRFFTNLDGLRRRIRNADWTMGNTSILYEEDENQRVNILLRRVLHDCCRIHWIYHYWILISTLWSLPPFQVFS